MAAEERTFRPSGPVAGLRHGYARIITNDGDGDYTITELVRDGAADQLLDQPGDYIDADARDLRGNAGGEVDSVVRWWEQYTLSGAVEVVIETVYQDAFTFGTLFTGWTMTGATDFNGVWVPSGFNVNGKPAYRTSRVSDSGMGETCGMMWWLTDASWVDFWATGSPRYASGGAWWALFADPQYLSGASLFMGLLGPQTGATPAGTWYWDEPYVNPSVGPESKNLSVYSG
ncbi:MAG: hypothetical protein ABFD92_00100 [Planctomycetaceae bacterium]|nr:hypothetical protein [Planctomycetaceae bacterium]